MNKVVKEVLKAIKEAAKSKVCHPANLKKGDILSFLPEDVTDWEVRKAGGFTHILNTYFPLTEKDHQQISEAKELSTYVRQLETKLGEKLKTEERFKEAIDANIKPLKVIPYKKSNKAKPQMKREIVGMLNDLHYGLKVIPEEVGNTNSFDWKEACRRTALFVKEMIDYKPHSRHEVQKLHLIINGDVIAGIIHALKTQGLDLLVHQVNGTMHILTHVLQALLAEFEEVEVYGISGNHDDSLHKRENGQRVSQEKYDAYTNNAFYGLSVAFRDNDRIKFNFPKTPYVFVNLLGGRAMVCHGDTIFSKALGNPGSSINVQKLSDAIHRFNIGEIAKSNKPIKLVLFGHVHTYAHFITSDGVEVYIAPSLSGTDPYVHGLNVNHNFIGQVVFESTEDFILGDSRLVRLNKADNDSSLDKIIPTFNRDLKWERK